MSMYEIDSAYVRRCQKRLQEWGAPLSGWYCEYIYDVADEEEDPDHIDLVIILFLYKHLSDDGKTLMIILGISE